MKPERLAELHRACFVTPPPWNTAAFEVFLADKTVFLVPHAHGFLLARSVLDQAEILTLAVDPAHRRLGIAAQMVAEFHRKARLCGAVGAFLEVAVDNTEASSLYKSKGYDQIGHRKNYYAAPNAQKIDALVMQYPL